MGQQAAEYARQYAWNIIVNRLRVEYAEMLQRVA
jgi:hypothetical protein